MRRSERMKQNENKKSDVLQIRYLWCIFELYDLIIPGIFFRTQIVLQFGILLTTQHNFLLKHFILIERPFLDLSKNTSIV